MTRTRAAFLIFILGFVCLQIFRWQERAVAVTRLELKGLVFSFTEEEHLRLGVFSRHFAHYRLADWHLRRVLEKSPGNLSAIANLALVSWQKGQLEEAEQFFTSYFARGGAAHDLMAAYARFHQSQNRQDEAKKWLYRSLFTYSQNQKVANELLDLLMLNGELYEALGLLGALIAEEGDELDFWKIRLKSVENNLNALQIRLENQEDQMKSFRVPSLDGRRTFVPVRSEDGGSVFFLLFERSENNLVINESDLALWSYDQLQRVKATPSNELQSLDELYIGPWRLENLKYKTCKDCHSLLGASILKDLSADVEVDGAVSFVRFSSRRTHPDQSVLDQ